MSLAAVPEPIRKLLAEAANMPLESVVLLTTGGTIASRVTSAGAAPGGVDVAALAATSKGPGADNLRTAAVFNRDSSDLTLEDLDTLVASVAATIRAGASGIVITHGTDTLEETALLLATAFSDATIPVVLTGAIRTADHPRPDGPANLTAAIAVAGDPGRNGVWVAFGGAVLPGWGLTKHSTDDLQPFAVTTDDAPEFLGPHRLSGLRVPVINSYPGAAEDLRRLVADGSGHSGGSGVSGGSGIDALVLVGTGSGNASTSLIAAVAELTGRIPVLVCSRVATGPVRPDYAGARALEAAGAELTELRTGPARMLALARAAARRS